MPGAMAIANLDTLESHTHVLTHDSKFALADARKSAKTASARSYAVAPSPFATRQMSSTHQACHGPPIPPISQALPCRQVKALASEPDGAVVQVCLDDLHFFSLLPAT